MYIKKQIHEVIKKSGWYLKLRKNLPPGLDWFLDVQRILGTDKITTIFDVGANIGQTAIPLSKEFPKAIIHCFEPIPETFEVLEKNVKGKSIHCHKLAMGANEGTTEIMAVPLAHVNSIVSGYVDNDPKAKKVLINISTVDHFCESHKISNISILKIDTEGYEIEVLQGCQRMLETSSISAIYLEITCDHNNQKLNTFLPDVIKKLSDFPMRFIGIYETDALVKKKSSVFYCNALFINEDQIQISNSKFGFLG